MGDPSIQNMWVYFPLVSNDHLINIFFYFRLGQLSGMNNVDALLETGRQLAMQMSSENPELFQQIRRQMDQNPGSQNPPQDPPSN